MENMDEIIINFCPTGMVPTKTHNPSIPLQPNEIVEQTVEAYELGITIVHLHARDPSGNPSYQKNIYEKIFNGIKQYCPELVICASCSGRIHPEFEYRSEVIESQPDMCSLTLGSLNFKNVASINSPEMINQLVAKMIEYGVKPELECFDLGMIHYGLQLPKLQSTNEPNYWNIIFGNISGIQLNLASLSAAIGIIPDKDYVALGGIGSQQFGANGLAVTLGLGVRVGLEDNNWMNREKKVMATNISLLNRCHQLIKAHEKKFMTPKTFGSKGFYNKNR